MPVLSRLLLVMSYGGINLPLLLQLEDDGQRRQRRVRPAEEMWVLSSLDNEGLIPLVAAEVPIAGVRPLNIVVVVATGCCCAALAFWLQLEPW